MINLKTTYTSLPDMLTTSVLGLTIVILTLALIMFLVIIISKAVKSYKSEPATSEPVIPTPDVKATAVQPVANAVKAASVELIDTDEKTAAVIMAIVSDNSGIPLNRLIFKSIKLK